MNQDVDNWLHVCGGLKYCKKHRHIRIERYQTSLNVYSHNIPPFKPLADHILFVLISTGKC